MCDITRIEAIVGDDFLPFIFVSTGHFEENVFMTSMDLIIFEEPFTKMHFVSSEVAS